MVQIPQVNIERYCIIGGSTTENYLLSPDLRFPYQVEQKIKQEYDSGFKIINAGVSGSSLAN